MFTLIIARCCVFIAQYQTFIGLILVLSSSLFNIFDNIYYNDTPD